MSYNGILVRGAEFSTPAVFHEIALVGGNRMSVGKEQVCGTGVAAVHNVRTITGVVRSAVDAEDLAASTRNQAVRQKRAFAGVLYRVGGTNVFGVDCEASGTDNGTLGEVPDALIDWI